jgi:hypothetical protein
MIQRVTIPAFTNAFLEKRVGDVYSFSQAHQLISRQHQNDEHQVRQVGQLR